MGKENLIKTIVLDDDPTGIQTVHGCLLVTKWDAETLTAALNDQVPYFYILTNTRAYGQREARKIIMDILSSIGMVNMRLGYTLRFIVRSDSTLRGHFPLELDLVAEFCRESPPNSTATDGFFFIPAFLEGGRVATDADMHYLVENGNRIPCHETEFARDSVFGYKSAYLPDYIGEKCGIPSSSVRTIPRSMLFAGRESELRRQLMSINCGTFFAVNALSYAELDVFSNVAHEAMDAGKRFLFQSAASFVKSFVQSPDKPLLNGENVDKNKPGCIIVGSHVPKTTRQLAPLAGAHGCRIIEIDIERLLAFEAEEYHRVRNLTAKAAAESLTPIIVTSRREIIFGDPEIRLEAGARISRNLTRLVQQLPYRPSFILAKGGITSHHILTEGLNVSIARVEGQIAPGVPVITLPPAHRFADIPYIIFPGNVGDDESLLEVYKKMAF